MYLSKVPIPKLGEMLDRKLANEISEYWAKENNTNVIKFIASGEWGKHINLKAIKF